MRKAQRGQRSIFLGEVGQGVHSACEPIGDQLQRVSHDDQVSVVDDERTGGAQVKDATGGGCDIAPGMKMGHDVVPESFLVTGCGGEVQ